MRDELIRAVIAAPLAVGLSGAAPHSRLGRGLRPLLGIVLVLAALASHLGDWRTWAVAGAVVIAIVLIGAPKTSWRATAGAALLVAIVAAAVTDQSLARRAIAHVADTRAVVIVIAGLLIAVFVAGQVIGWLLEPFATKIGEGAAPGLENAGRVIGWLERALLYGLILAGAPDAAAIVIAAKSVARFPAFRREAFAEYYLIGTLLSFIAAGVVGVAVRAALGLPLLTTSA